MEYKLKSGKNIKTVQAEIEKDSRLKAEIDGQKFEASFLAVSDRWLHLTVNGNNINAYAADTDQGKIIFINGRYYELQDAEKLESASRRKDAAEIPDRITPLTPSVVISVLVKEGETVEKGQGVIVLSAMKMETTLKAPFSGKVAKINVAPGDKAAPGEILAEITPLSD